MFQSDRNVDISFKDLISFIFDNQAYDQNRPVYIDASNRSRSYSSNQARTAIRCLVAGLREFGLKRGDCVLINSLSHIDYSILWLGVIASGCVCTGSNPSYSTTELVHQLRQTDTRMVITQIESFDKVASAAAQANIPAKNVLAFNHEDTPTPPGARSWKDLLSHGEDDWVRFDDEDTAKRTIAAFMMTSGTTGLSKAAAISHHNLVATQTLAYDMEEKDFHTRRLLYLPQYATAAIHTNHICPFRFGETVYVMSRFQLDDFFRNVERYEITELSVVPTVVISVIHSPLATRKVFRSVRYVHSGGAPLGKESQAKLKALLPDGCPYTQIWGMTETSGAAMNLFYPHDDPTGSVGTLVPNMKAKLCDEEGNDISAYDVRGELLIKGPTIMTGYYKNLEANEKAFDAEGYLKTGDIFYCDRLSKLWYIVDRRKDLIKVRGFQVAPVELEDIILRHPEIEEAAVVGIPKPSEGTELPRAFVIRTALSKVTEEEVQKFVDKEVVSYKRLTGGVVFLNSIPKTASGKIQKNVLRDMNKPSSKL